MRIALIAPLIESVPPRLYGGTERIVSYLCEELVAQGHDVTLFASGDSETKAKLVPCCDQALRLDPSIKDIFPYYMLMIDRARRMTAQFDILHFHIDQFHFPVFRETAHKTLTTLHGRQDLPDLKRLYAGFPEMPLSSISIAQRAPLPDVAFAGNIAHGLPRDLLTPSLNARGGYLAFLGRISPEKRVDRTIEIARAVGLPLKRSRPRWTVWTRSISARRSSRCLPSPASSTSARSTTGPRAASWAMPARCSSRSTGRSRSGSC
jgi:glycosyltransferase involved in cell wall biosynthesis